MSVPQSDLSKAILSIKALQERVNGLEIIDLEPQPVPAGLIINGATGEVSFERLSWLLLMAAGPVAAWMVAKGIELPVDPGQTQAAALAETIKQMAASAVPLLWALQGYRKRHDRDRLEMRENGRALRRSAEVAEVERERNKLVGGW